MRPMKPRVPGSAHECLEMTIAEIGEGQGTDAWGGSKLAADFLGVKPTTFNHLLDPDHSTGELSFVRVGQLVAHFKPLTPARFLAGLADCRLARVPRSGAATTEEQALLSIAKESTEVLATGWAALADGNISTSEARLMRRQISEAVEALLELDARLEAGGAK
jgi:hypothetical protein